MENILKIKVDNIHKKEYEGLTTTYIQTIQKSETKGFEVIKIKLTDTVLNFKDGDFISIPVKLSAMNSQIFYTQNGKIELAKGV